MILTVFDGYDEYHKPIYKEIEVPENGAIGRTASTGAYRDTVEGKLDFEGFLSPIVLRRYAEYMDKNRLQSNGVMRDSDNWQAGMPRAWMRKSMWRHFYDVWALCRGHKPLSEGHNLEDALCALLFNVMGLLNEVLLKRDIQENK